MKKKPSWILPLIVFSFIFIGLLIRNLKFSKLPFYDWDEALYAQPAIEIIQNKTLITTFNGHLWLNKPPLVHALVAGVFLLFGRSEFWARAVMILLALILLLLIYFLAQSVLNKFFRKEINRFPPWQREFFYLSPILIIGSSSLFLEKAIFLNSDLIVALAWLGYFLCVENYWLKLLFLLVGVWSKSVFGFYPLAYEVISMRKKYLTRENVLKTCLLLFLSLFWYFYNYLRFGNYFIQDHFLDQILKRLVVPIELHFGGKFYYFEYLWKDFNFINVLFVIGYLILLVDFYKFFRQKGLKLRNDPRWWPYLVLLSPLPFFVFLTLIKTKLYWYLMMIIPLIALTVPYLLLRINRRLINMLVFLVLFAYFLFQFIPQTYSLQTNISIPDKVAVAKCLSQKPAKQVALLTDEQERKNQNFLEAAHYQTITSFLYGGAPSFVYYVQKKVDFYYNVDEFIKNSPRYSELVISTQDLESNDKLTQIEKNKKISCPFGKWVGLTSD